jgi:hypothetical protein
MVQAITPLIYLQTNYNEIIVMPICMASYMKASYGHVNHAFRVNVRF